MPSESVRKLLSYLGDVKPVGDGYQAHCPAHDDEDPSLTVDEGKDGKVLIRCHAGCDNDHVLDALGLTWRELNTDEPLPKQPKRNGSGRKIEAVYTYTDEAGNPLFETVRYEPKDFRQRQKTEDGYQWNLKGVRPVLYRLPELDDAIQNGNPVYLVEGEKDADRLAELGLTATTAPMGAGKWRAEYSQYLRRAHVIIIPDHDEAGIRHAYQVADQITGVAQTVKVVTLPGLSDKQDVCDWLDKDHTADDLAEIVNVTPYYQPDASPPYSLESEESVLSIWLSDPENMIAASELSPEVFYFRRHRLLAQEMVSMDQSGEPIDLVKLTTRFRDKDLLDEINGDWLRELAQRDVHRDRLGDYSQIVHEKATQRKIHRWASEAATRALDSTEDLSALITDLTSELESIEKTSFQGAADVTIISDDRDRMSAYFEDLKSKGMNGISTGYASLNIKSKGLRRGGITLIGARPSVGKSSLMLNMAIRQADMGLKVGLLSLEMDRTDIHEWGIQLLGGMTDADIRKAHQDGANKVDQAMSIYFSLPIWMYSNEPRLDLVLKALRQFYVKEECDVIYLDHFHYLQNPKARATGSEYWSGIARQLAGEWKRITRKVGRPAHFVWLTQLRKSVDKNPYGRPRLDDFRETSDLEAFATMACGLSSPDLIGADKEKDVQEKDPITLELSLLKNRHGRGGPGVIVPMHFTKATRQILDYNKDRKEPVPMNLNVSAVPF